MPKVTPFKAIRPIPTKADAFCALPYDVYNRKEACEIVKKNPLSFLSIDRAETSFGDDTDTYDPKVYQKARELLLNRMQDGTLIRDEKPCYYAYELTMNGRTQTGIVACSSVDDYMNSVIKKHENTREEKELDRINHVDITNAHTGPIFLVYRSEEELKSIVSSSKTAEKMLYDFTSDDGIRHRAFIIDDEDKIRRIGEIFDSIPCTYIADGHHRCASAVKVGLKRRDQAGEGSNSGSDVPGYERFLSVIFPDDELMIMPYNRVVKDLNGMSKEEFISAINKAGFKTDTGSDTPVSPSKKAQFGMFLDGKWYRLEADEKLISTDPVKGLDVSILQDNLLGPILGIQDPRTDKRIDFVGGIRGLGELEKRCSEDMKVAFSMYPTSIRELLDVADAGLLMPPKSTWFEPKLRSGMFIHSLDD
ncbi:MAG: DUF1015 family protein [Lachnospiraceae bacterium]|nr:DUF1015 family protein [Lachnospiraceae bacterium]